MLVDRLAHEHEGDGERDAADEREAGGGHQPHSVQEVCGDRADECCQQRDKRGAIKARDEGAGDQYDDGNDDADGNDAHQPSAAAHFEASYYLIRRRLSRQDRRRGAPDGLRFRRKS